VAWQACEHAKAHKACKGKHALVVHAHPFTPIKVCTPKGGPPAALGAF